MRQKAVSKEKQNPNKTGQCERYARSKDGLRPSERSAGARPDVPAQFQPMPLEPCLDSAATYDPNVNYAIVLATLLLLLDRHDAERRERQHI